MSRYTIEMNFSRAKHQAEQLEEAASRLEKIASGSIDEALGTVSGNWKGENADQYLRKAQTVRDKLLTTSGDIKGTAQTVRTIAETIYKAEMAALELALKRNT